MIKPDRSLNLFKYLYNESTTFKQYEPYFSQIVNIEMEWIDEYKISVTHLIIIYINHDVLE